MNSGGIQVKVYLLSVGRIYDENAQQVSFCENRAAAMALGNKKAPQAGLFANLNEIDSENYSAKALRASSRES